MTERIDTLLDAEFLRLGWDTDCITAWNTDEAHIVMVSYYDSSSGEDDVHDVFCNGRQLLEAVRSLPTNIEWKTLLTTLHSCIHQT